MTGGGTYTIDATNIHYKGRSPLQVSSAAARGPREGSMSSGEALLSMDATDQAMAVATGEVSASELVDAAIARLEDVNPRINAVIHPSVEAARQRASRPVAGPFRGFRFW